MAVKYECPECGRRFLEWGAEKNGFKCPNDDSCPDNHPENVELIAITFEQDQPIRRKPTLKRTAAAAKRRRAVAKVESEESLLAKGEEVDIELEVDIEASDGDDDIIDDD